MDPDATNVRIHRMSWLRRSLMWWCLGPFVLIGLMVLVFGEPGSRGAGGVIIAMMLPWLVWWHWWSGRIQLRVTRDGLTLSEGRRTMEATWSNIERIRVDKGRESIVLKEPVHGKAAERLASLRGFMMSGQPMYDEEQRLLMADHRIIPIQAFAYLMRNGTLQRSMEPFAPALAAATSAAMEEQKRAASLPRPPASPAEQRKNLYIFLVLAVSFGLGIYLAVAPTLVSAWVITTLYAVVMPLVALLAAWSSWNAFRARSKTLGIIFLVSFVIFSLWTVEQWSRLGQLTHAEDNRSSAPSLLNTVKKP